MMKVFYLLTIMFCVFTSFATSQDYDLSKDYSYSYGIVCVPIATLYEKQDTNSLKMTTLKEAQIFSITNADITNDWVAITMTNGLQYYTPSKNVAFGGSESPRYNITLDIPYVVILARQGAVYDKDEYDLTYFPFLYEPQSQKAHLIRSIAFSNDVDVLKIRTLELADTRVECEFKVNNNLIYIKSHSGGIMESVDDGVATYISSTHDYYFSLHKTTSGQFWLLSNLPEEQKLKDYVETLWTGRKKYLFQSEFYYNSSEEMSYTTPYLKDAKTGKDYYIYVSSPAGHEYLFDKGYIQFLSSNNDTGYFTFVVYEGLLIIYEGSYLGGKLNEVNIYWYQPKMVNGKIMAKELTDNRRYLKLAR